MFLKAEEYTKKRSEFKEGNRNNFILLLASNCNRMGLDEAYCLKKCNELYVINDDQKEVTKTVEGVYERYRDAFGEWNRKSLNAASQKISGYKDTTGDKNSKSYISKTPFIDQDVIQKMPDLLRNTALLIQDERQRDVYLTGMLTAVSAVMHNVKGLYGYDYRYPGLYSFICSESGSGKGVMKLVYKSFLPYHEKLRISGLMSEPISDQSFFIPANGNSTKQKLLLKANKGKGFIYEPGSTSLEYTLEKDSSGLLQILKYGYDHETLGSAREMNRRVVEVSEPKIACSLSGTSNNIGQLIPNVFDGLFGCFVFYAYNSELGWFDQKPGQQAKAIQQQIDDNGKTILKLAEYIDHHSMEFTFSDDQWEIFNSTFKKSVANVACFAGDEINGYLRRLAISSFKIAMIITVLERFEAGETSPQIECSENAFNISLHLMRVYLQHTMAIQVDVLLKGRLSNEQLKEFYNYLPDEFNRTKALEVGASLSARIQQPTVDSYLGRLVNYGLVKRAGQSQYEKINFEEELSNVVQSSAA
jgi:hypothetical protein